MNTGVICPKLLVKLYFEIDIFFKNKVLDLFYSLEQTSR